MKFQKYIFGAFTKVEEQPDGTLHVEGIASSETRDVQGELIRASAMNAALPDYMKFPAIREMHQPLAAGRTLGAYVNPEDNKTYITAKVVDKDAIDKVKHGVYNGFSIGGDIPPGGRNKDDRTIIERLSLMEISLVDRPANPDAVLTFYKADLSATGANMTDEEQKAAEAKKVADAKAAADALVKAAADKAAADALAKKAADDAAEAEKVKKAADAAALVKAEADARAASIATLLSSEEFRKAIALATTPDVAALTKRADEAEAAVTEAGDIVNKMTVERDGLRKAIAAKDEEIKTLKAEVAKKGSLRAVVVSKRDDNSAAAVEEPAPVDPSKLDEKAQKAAAIDAMKKAHTQPTQLP